MGETVSPGLGRPGRRPTPYDEQQQRTEPSRCGFPGSSRRGHAQAASCALPSRDALLDPLVRPAGPGGDEMADPMSRRWRVSTAVVPLRHQPAPMAPTRTYDEGAEWGRRARADERPRQGHPRPSPSSPMPPPSTSPTANVAPLTRRSPARPAEDPADPSNEQREEKYATEVLVRGRTIGEDGVADDLCKTDNRAADQCAYHQSGPAPG